MSEGERVVALLQTATNSVLIVAPFIKRRAFLGLIGAVPDGVPIRCVTRWRSQEVAAGVSDPEIIDDVLRRPDTELMLADTLHAKIYGADQRCLVGSANVTDKALGGADDANIEVLVGSALDDEGVAATLRKIASVERPATSELARQAREIADLLEAQGRASLSEDPWLPVSFKPELAYREYSVPSSGARSAVRLVQVDVGLANLPPGLTLAEFHDTIRLRLRELPIAQLVLSATSDTTIHQTDPEVEKYLIARSTDETTSNDMWRSFSDWMTHFFADSVMRQEVAAWGLRHARKL